MQQLEIRNIRKTFGNSTALNDVTLSVEEGELFFLLGPSGCGKTTLLRIIAGLEIPDAGSLSFGSRDFLKIPVEERNLGMVFQNYSLWPHMTVAENVTYGLALRKVPKEEARGRAEEALSKTGLAGYGDRKPGTLSGGEQQRAALARAIVTRPKLLLLDEPLSNLDAALRLEMRGEIRRLHRELSITMVYVTHDQEEAAALADRMAVMRSGRVEQIGAPGEIYNSPVNAFVGGFFGESNLVNGRLEAIQRGTVRASCNGTLLEAVVKPDFSARPGDGKALLFRPHHLQRVQDGNGRNRFSAVIRSAEFSGPLRRYSAESPLGLIKFQEPEKSPALKEGERITLHIPAEDIRVLSNE